jgi:hypothetical protein
MAPTEGQVECTAWSGACPAGQKFIAGNTTHDRTCEACTDGFVTATGTTGLQASCTAWSGACSGGEAFIAGSATADRTCVACTSSDYINASGTLALQASCTDWSNCPAGQGLKTAGDATTDTLCEVCGVDDYEFSLGDDLSACADHTKCPVGQGSNWETLSTANQHQSACANCSSSTYSDADGYGACVARKTDCPAGQFFTPGSVSADANCTACTSGFTGSTGGTTSATSCTAWTADCAAGNSFTAGTPTANRICTPCVGGYIASAGTATSCTSYSACPAGEAYSPGNATHDRSCEACPAGTAILESTTTCDECPVGKYTPLSEKNDECKYCLSGTYQENDDYTQCQTCPTGQWTAGADGTLLAPNTECVAIPTPYPTAAPTPAPSDFPTAAPTAAPTASPTAAPTDFPTAAPTLSPTAFPTAAPTLSPTAAPTDAVLKTAPPSPAGGFVNSVTAAPTPEPTTVSAEQVATLIEGATCLSTCQADAPAASTTCEYYSYTLNQCGSFATCSATEATTVKNKCLAEGSCSNTQCGVPASVQMVEVPKAAVTTAMPMQGISVEDLAGDVNLQLALRGGVADSLGVETDDVKIASMTATTRRRLSAGVEVVFEVAIAEASAGAAAEMKAKIETQAETFDTFIKAKAADLGVLDSVATLVVEAAAISTEQAVTKTLPASFDATDELPAAAIPTFAPTPAKLSVTLAPKAAAPAAAGLGAGAMAGAAVAAVLVLLGLLVYKRQKAKKSRRPSVYAEGMGGKPAAGKQKIHMDPGDLEAPLAPSAGGPVMGTGGSRTIHIAPDDHLQPEQKAAPAPAPVPAPMAALPLMVAVDVDGDGVADFLVPAPAGTAMPQRTLDIDVDGDGQADYTIAAEAEQAMESLDVDTLLDGDMGEDQHIDEIVDVDSLMDDGSTDF